MMDFVQQHIWLIAIAVVSGGMLLWSFAGPMILGIPQVNTFEATQLINQRDAMVLDVRDEGEFRSGHIPRSRHVPLTAIGSRIKELEKFREKPVVLVCRSGNRAGTAAGLLKKNGFQDVRVLRGGVLSWEQANLPVERT
jgi:rhodanese-related sulfurtransferase